MVAHMKLPIEPAFFDTWLSLWCETTTELFAPETALHFREKARRIAESLKLGLFFRPGSNGSGAAMTRRPPDPSSGNAARGPPVPADTDFRRKHDASRFAARAPYTSRGLGTNHSPRRPVVVPDVRAASKKRSSRRGRQRRLHPNKCTKSSLTDRSNFTSNFQGYRPLRVRTRCYWLSSYAWTTVSLWISNQAFPGKIRGAQVASHRPLPRTSWGARDARPPVSPLRATPGFSTPPPRRAGVFPK